MYTKKLFHRTGIVMSVAASVHFLHVVVITPVEIISLFNESTENDVVYSSANIFFDTTKYSLPYVAEVNTTNKLLLTVVIVYPDVTSS